MTFYPTRLFFKLSIMLLWLHGFCGRFNRLHRIANPQLELIFKYNLTTI